MPISLNSQPLSREITKASGIHKATVIGWIFIRTLSGICRSTFKEDYTWSLLRVKFSSGLASSTCFALAPDPDTVSSQPAKNITAPSGSLLILKDYIQSRISSENELIKLLTVDTFPTALFPFKYPKWFNKVYWFSSWFPLSIAIQQMALA